MPVYQVRQNFNDIPFMQHLYRLSFFLVIAGAFCNDQDLASRMGVPVVSGAWLEDHVSYYRVESVIGRDQVFDPGRSCKIISWRLFALREDGAFIFGCIHSLFVCIKLPFSVVIVVWRGVLPGCSFVVAVFFICDPS